MLSKLPIDLEKISKDLLDMEILRAGIIAELDAITWIVKNHENLSNTL